MVAGHSRNLVNTLKGRQNVREVARVTGPYDVIVVMEAEDVDEISDLVTEDVHSLAGVVRTTTCVSMG
jgi:DNA-binding Lrp family transcriptional regulator